VTIFQTSLETECRNEVGWISLEESAVKAQTLHDVVSYTFFVENYAACRHFLQMLAAVSPTVLVPI
jgi:hypothetical protein